MQIKRVSQMNKLLFNSMHRHYKLSAKKILKAIFSSAGRKCSPNGIYDVTRVERFDW